MKKGTAKLNQTEKKLRRVNLNYHARKINNFKEIIPLGSYWDDYIQKKQTQEKAFDYVKSALLSFKRKEVWRKLRKDFENMEMRKVQVDRDSGGFPESAELKLN